MQGDCTRHATATRKAVDQLTAFLQSVDHPVDQAENIEQKKTNESL